MLYVSGIIIIVKNAGTATSNLSQAILPSGATISAPTIIKAGAVTFVVTTDRSGEKTSPAKENARHNSREAGARPAATPELDST